MDTTTRFSQYTQSLLRNASLGVLTVALCSAPLRAEPAGGRVVAGQATINTGVDTTVGQSSDKAIINWDAFDVASNETVTFNQPNADSVILNRVTSIDVSQIDGRISANGNVVIVNPNGMVFGDGAQIDVGSLIATTANISNADFMAGRMQFNQPGVDDAIIVNGGRITAREGGLVALVAPNVRNDGLISARIGKVALGGTETFAVDLYGDGLINFAVGDAINSSATSVENSGTISAQGGRVVLSAASAGNAVDGVVNLNGIIDASTVGDKTGKVEVQGDKVHVDGAIKVDGYYFYEDGGEIEIQGGSVALDGDISAIGEKGDGGLINVNADYVALGGTISADGLRHGGAISVDAQKKASLAETISAVGVLGDGGSVDIASGGGTIETSSSVIDVSGRRNGGDIANVARDSMLTSGNYFAIGGQGTGGTIDLSANAVNLLSPELNASGASGGRIRIGGEFQGGKDLENDELVNAASVFVTDGTVIDVAASGAFGNGGEAIIWSNEETIFLGNVDGRPGTSAGLGGFAEISSAGSLGYGGIVTTGREDRKGSVLLDPKDIFIVEDSAQTSLDFAVRFLGDFRRSNNIDLGLDVFGDNFGSSIAIDSNRAAIGAALDDGFADDVASAGAVYLLEFDDENFSGGRLVGIIGDGYLGGDNIDLSLNTKGRFGGSRFGEAVALDGTRLAAAASNEGNVYLFEFSEGSFSQGKAVSVIGELDSRPSGINSIYDNNIFARALSFDGSRLAIGAFGTGVGSAQGFVYLFDFDANSVANGDLTSVLFTGSATPFVLLQEDTQSLEFLGQVGFGSGVALEGSRLAVGATGSRNGGDAGAVFIFDLPSNNIADATLLSTISNEEIEGAGVSNLLVDLPIDGNFGSAVALLGDRLAVGASATNTPSNDDQRGAAYLFEFDRNSPSESILLQKIASTLDPTATIELTLSFRQGFGGAIALGSNLLAIGGGGNDQVYLISPPNEAPASIRGNILFSNDPSADYTISASALAGLLASPQDVRLEANNDIQLLTDLTVNNPNGGGGDLTLVAGRSILLDGSINTDNGDLNLYANAITEPNFVPEQRDDGQASITLATGRTITTVTGNVDSKLYIGSGFSSQDGISIDAASVTADNDIRYVEGSRVPTVSDERRPSDTAINVGDQFSITTERFLFNDDLDYDQPGGGVSLTVAGLPDGLSAADNGDGTVTFSGATSAAGSNTITITAADDRDQTVTTSFVLTVETAPVEPEPEPEPGPEPEPTGEISASVDATLSGSSDSLDDTALRDLFAQRELDVSILQLGEWQQLSEINQFLANLGERSVTRTEWRLLWRWLNWGSDNAGTSHVPGTTDFELTDHFTLQELMSARGYAKEWAELSQLAWPVWERLALAIEANHEGFNDPALEVLRARGSLIRIKYSNLTGSELSLSERLSFGAKETATFAFDLAKFGNAFASQFFESRVASIKGVLEKGDLNSLSKSELATVFLTSERFQPTEAENLANLVLSAREVGSNASESVSEISSLYMDGKDNEALAKSLALGNDLIGFLKEAEGLLNQGSNSSASQISGLTLNYSEKFLAVKALIDEYNSLTNANIEFLSSAEKALIWLNFSTRALDLGIGIAGDMTGDIGDVIDGGGGAKLKSVSANLKTVETFTSALSDRSTRDLEAYFQYLAQIAPASKERLEKEVELVRDAVEWATSQSETSKTPHGDAEMSLEY